MEKTAKFFGKTCPPPIRKVLGKHFLTSFKTNGEEHKRRRRLISSEHVFFFLIMLDFSSSSDSWLHTLGCFPHPGPSHWIPGLLKGKQICFVNLLRQQWAKSWGHCGLCVTQQECPHLKFRRLLQVYSVLAVLGLYIWYTNNLSCLSCPWGNPELSPVITVTGWQDAISELSLALDLGCSLSLLGNVLYLEISFIAFPVVSSPVGYAFLWNLLSAGRNSHCRI